jgi:hypothetical protein
MTADPHQPSAAAASHAPAAAEEQRLSALHEHGILDRPSNAQLDRIVALAAEILGTPIALISLVDRDRQWFLSRLGLEAKETPLDVAFCDHAVPDTPLWKKVYFGTDRLMTWQGRRLSHKDYHRGSHVFNAAHWLASVSLGRTYGAMLGPRYLEIRYEDLCRDFLGQMAVVADFLGMERRRGPLAEFASCVSAASIGKHRLRPVAAVREVLEIETPLLLSLGYLDTDPLAKPSRSLRRRLSAWMGRTPERNAA